MNASRRIKVAVAPYPKMMEVHSLQNGTLEVSGYEGRFLLIVLKELGLSYEIVMPHDKTAGSLQPDGNWTGTIQMILMEEVDLAFSVISVIEDRWNAVKMSKGYNIYEWYVNSFKPGSIKPPFAFLYPFNLATWISLFIVLAIISFVFANFFTRKNRSFCSAFFKYFASIIGQPLHVEESSLGGNILIFFWLLFAVVISGSYSATLLSFIMKPLQGAPIRNLQELSEAVQKGTHKGYVLPPFVPFFLKSKEKHVRELGEAIQRNGWILDNEKIASMDYITHHSSQILCEIMSKLYFGTRDDVYISTETVASRSVAFAYSKHFCCVSKLNRILTKLSGSGISEKLLRDESLKIDLKSPKKFESNVGHVLYLTDLAGVFLILVVGYSFSFIALLGEVVYSRIKRKTDVAKNSNLLNLGVVSIGL
ncbi:uncharacterized protein NPIL_256721 [Nephila pilipes]|uniref:Uncharacterized protein n=1 Tax=Nephila pilipes TaxID=299642 RepID=A0A8X6QJZ8_NEPPI|nr:uncharacterized protein NPIL_256721 [Nephila pilipes]